jgi:hypothetical protein
MIERIAELEAELAEVTKVNHSVAVCAEHTGDITLSDGLENGCLWCEIQKLETEVERLSKGIKEAIEFTYDDGIRDDLDMLLHKEAHDED